MLKISTRQSDSNAPTRSQFLKSFLFQFVENSKIDKTVWSTKKRRKTISFAKVFNIPKEVPIERAYDFSFAKKADGELTQGGWKS